MENLSKTSYNSNIDELEAFFTKIKEEKKKVEELKNSIKNRKFIEYDSKNYLDVKLLGKETEKTITFRPLPFDPENNINIPFYKIYSHGVKKGNDFKYYTCLNKTEGIDHLGLGKECPFCTIIENTNEELKTVKDEITRKKLKDIIWECRIFEQWLMRGIDRDNESDGPKLWRFNSNSKNKGNYDKMIQIYNDRKKESEKKHNASYNIFDINEGKDLNITITKTTNAAGKVEIGVSQITDASDKSPVTEDKDQLEKWVNDPRKWWLLLPPKPLDYLKIVTVKGTPRFEKEYGVFADKDEYDEIKKNGGEPVFNPETSRWQDREADEKSNVLDDTNFSNFETIIDVSTTSDVSTEYSQDDLPF
jgi:hypothetical protein